MKDPAEKQTASIPLEQPKRGRGRPKTGAALTPAQKQKAYRERLKSNVTGKEATPGEVEKLREMARAEFKRAESLKAQVVNMGLKIAQLEHEVKKLKQDAGATKKRYVLQFKYEEQKEWMDDETGDYGSKKDAEKACKRMNESVSKAEWRVRERQWV